MKRLAVVSHPRPLTAAAILAIVAPGASAQSLFTGRVLTDSGLPIAGAEVFLNGPQNIQRTNTLGEFRFTRVPAGYHVVGARMPGFAPKVDTIEVAEAGEVQRNLKLSRIETKLPEVPITTTLLDRKLADFHDRRRFGIGRFLDSAEFAKAHGTRTSDRLTRLPGLVIQRGRSSDAYVASTRSRTASGRMCRAGVWLDGVINLGISFNVNEIDPSHIAAIEWYAGQALIPVRFGAPPRRGEPTPCGVLVIWTR